MNNEAHALLLGAYIDQLTLADLKKILDAQARAVGDNLNHTLTSQIIANNEADKAIQDAVNNINPEYLDVIEYVIKHNAGD